MEYSGTAVFITLLGPVGFHFLQKQQLTVFLTFPHPQQYLNQWANSRILIVMLHFWDYCSSFNAFFPLCMNTWELQQQLLPRAPADCRAHCVPRFQLIYLNTAFIT